jgi:hypothetical protein
MAQNHPFTFAIAPDALTQGRFRWTICTGKRVDTRSSRSYAREDEARIEAKKAFARRVSRWAGLDEL